MSLYEIKRGADSDRYERGRRGEREKNGAISGKEEKNLDRNKNATLPAASGDGWKRGGERNAADLQNLYRRRGEGARKKTGDYSSWIRVR